jgi:hypothetical protein
MMMSLGAPSAATHKFLLSSAQLESGKLTPMAFDALRGVEFNLNNKHDKRGRNMNKSKQKKQKISHTGNRTRAYWVKASYPSH